MRKPRFVSLKVIEFALLSAVPSPQSEAGQAADPEILPDTNLLPAAEATLRRVVGARA